MAEIMILLVPGRYNWIKTECLLFHY